MQANADVPIVRLPNTIYDVISEVKSTKARERPRVQTGHGVHKRNANQTGHGVNKRNANQT